MILALLLACDVSLSAHVYKPQRLHVIDACRCLDGVLVSRRTEPDGDYHLRMKLDDGSTIVVEAICEARVRQKDVGTACVGARKVAVPKLRKRVRACGPFVLDTKHNWNELHPVEFFPLP